MSTTDYDACVKQDVESFSAILSDDFASIPRVKLGSDGETVFQNIKSSHWVFSMALVE